MKTRRHHNNEGRRQIACGKTKEQVKRIAVKMNIPYAACGTTRNKSCQS